MIPDDRTFAEVRRGQLAEHLEAYMVGRRRTSGDRRRALRCSSDSRKHGGRSRRL
jgi:hypothetical protein